MDSAELERRFLRRNVSTMQQNFLNFARSVDTFISDGREKSLAMTCLEEAMFWTGAAIGRKDDAETQPT